MQWKREGHAEPFKGVMTITGTLYNDGSQLGVRVAQGVDDLCPRVKKKVTRDKANKDNINFQYLFFFFNFILLYILISIETG